MPVHISIHEKNLGGCTLLAGFHGFGETGYIATSYLIHALEAERIGFIKVDHPPPFISTSEDGIVTPFEVYRKRRFVVVRSEFSPHRTEEAEFARVLAGWAVEKRFRDAVIVGGLDSNISNGNGDLRILPTRAYLPKARRFNAPTLEAGLLVYGQLAIMLSEFEMHNFPAVALLPCADASSADPRAAAVALRYLAKGYRLNVKVSELEESAGEVKADVERRMREAGFNHRMYA